MKKSVIFGIACLGVGGVAAYGLYDEPKKPAGPVETAASCDQKMQEATQHLPKKLNSKGPFELAQTPEIATIAHNDEACRARIADNGWKFTWHVN